VTHPVGGIRAKLPRRSGPHLCSDLQSRASQGAGRLGDGAGSEAEVVWSEDALEIPQARVRLKIVRRAADTGGEYVEFEVTGRPRGFFALPHVHDLHPERIEVLAGAMSLRLDGDERVLRAGECVEIPAGRPHAQRVHRDEPFHIRVQWKPPGAGEAFGERLAAMSRDGGLTRSGYPRPLAAARLGLEFGRYTHPAWPPLRVQLAGAAVLVRTAEAVQRLRARLRAAASRA
jgi:quercetin dioxygenase-like cupin family protein